MHLKFNGTEEDCDVATLDELVEIKGLANQKIAVAVNMEFIPRSGYRSTSLRDGDEIEIVSPRQGG